VSFGVVFSFCFDFCGPLKSLITFLKAMEVVGGRIVDLNSQGHVIGGRGNLRSTRFELHRIMSSEAEMEAAEKRRGIE
jgi:hypothetical protein